MKTRKLLLTVAVLMLVAAVFVACGSKEEAVWTITIEGADKSEFTSVDYSKLEEVSADTVLAKKDGSTKEQTWEGVLLKDVVEYIGAGDYTSITVEASDGYAKDYTPDIVNDSLTLLGTKSDGEAISEDDGYVQTVVGNQPGNMWIKMLVKITVNK